MIILKKYIPSTFILYLSSFIVLNAQGKHMKVQHNYLANNDIVVALNTSHTQVLFEPWDKNEVRVEAYIEGGNLNADMIDELLNSWHLDISQTDEEIKINTTTDYNSSLSNKQKVKVQARNPIQNMDSIISSILIPVMADITKSPMTDTTIQKSIYLKKNQINDKNRQQQEEIHQWIYESTNPNTINASNTVTAVGADFGGSENMYLDQMLIWANQFIEQTLVKRNAIDSKLQPMSTYNRSVDHVKNLNKVVKINIPKYAKLNLNIRHGSLVLEKKVTDVVASLYYSRLKASQIDGKQTYITTSYAPVEVEHWQHGRLVLNYVKNCSIQNAKTLSINSDSSNIYINNLTQKGSFTCSFGRISVNKLNPTFTTFDLAVENSDIYLKLPKIPFQITYGGSQSRIEIPQTLQTKVRSNFGNVFINGYYNSRNTDRLLNIQAKYSKIALK